MRYLQKAALFIVAASACKSPNTNSGISDFASDQLLATLPAGLAETTVPSNGIETYVRPYTASSPLPAVFDGVWWQQSTDPSQQFVFSFRNTLWDPTTRTLSMIQMAPNASATSPANKDSTNPFVFNPPSNPNNNNNNNDDDDDDGILSGYQIIFASDMQSAILNDGYTDAVSRVRSYNSDFAPRLKYISDGEWQRSDTKGKLILRLRRIVNGDGTRTAAYADYLAQFGPTAVVYVPALVMESFSGLSFTPSTNALGSWVLLDGDNLMTTIPPVASGASWCDPIFNTPCLSSCAAHDVVDFFYYSNGGLCRVANSPSSGGFLVSTQGGAPVQIGDPSGLTVPSKSGTPGTAILMTDKLNLIPLQIKAATVAGPVKLQLTPIPSALLEPGASINLALTPGSTETLVRVTALTKADQFIMVTAQSSQPFELRSIGLSSNLNSHPAAFDQVATSQSYIVRGDGLTLAFGAANGTAANVTVTATVMTSQTIQQADLVVDGPAVTYHLSSITGYDEINIVPSQAMLTQALAKLTASGKQVTSVPAGTPFPGRYTVKITPPTMGFLEANLATFLKAPRQMQQGSLHHSVYLHNPTPPNSVIVSYVGDPNLAQPVLDYTIQVVSGSGT